MIPGLIFGAFVLLGILIALLSWWARRLLPPALPKQTYTPRPAPRVEPIEDRRKRVIRQVER